VFQPNPGSSRYFVYYLPWETTGGSYPKVTYVRSVIEPEPEWADRARTMSVRANADTPEDATRARGFGAQGIGLCRTEHMVPGDHRRPKVPSQIMGGDAEGRGPGRHRL